MAPLLAGCDFSSSPTRRKPIVLALGQLDGDAVVLQRLQALESLQDWGDWLRAPPAPVVAGFDLPFGLPRELVQALGWPLQWQACMAHYAGLTRAQIRDCFAAFCAQRPPGGKFAHRATDGPAGSSPSMKWVNPPVAFMMHAGVPRLIAAGWHLPGLLEGDARRVALEAYPGLLARALIGRRSYKSDTRAKQSAERLAARQDLLARLQQPGATGLELHLRAGAALCDVLVQDARGDCLDAVLCLVQAAWGARRHATGDALYGLPEGLDPLEGAIVTAQGQGVDLRPGATSAR
ncbi:hypothetical protein GCM10022279_10190 [Comamonas faecalis]|uniref:DUF429 domain-containing protein n=1 Tax=Comamonas faecalis TaxID=1387849 RepID=A0ABP7QX24_9BURK